jgi:1-aminocyclopropane-1-carboxylate deaminase/D-cysteine desulfhydrase-like pyridoxal-dependent ACC family enzyme
MTFASDGSIRRQDKGTTSSKQQRWPGGRENSNSTSGERCVVKKDGKTSTIGSLGYFMKSSRNPLVNAAAIFVWE